MEALRDAGESSTTLAGWDEGLITAADGYVAVCIVDVSDVPGLKGDPDYMARWMTEDGANGVVTMWAAH